MANASGHCSELYKLFNSPKVPTKVPTNLPIRPTFAIQNMLPHLVLTTVIYAGVYEKAGSPGAGLVVWGLTGILATLCTLAYAELGKFYWGLTGILATLCTLAYAELGKFNWGLTGILATLCTLAYAELGKFYWGLTGILATLCTLAYAELGKFYWGLTGILATLCTLAYAELGVLDMTCDELFDNGDFLKAPNILS